MAEEWISLREFARRRGVSLTAVQKAIASGRVKAVRRDESGRLTGIEPSLATAEWNGNTDIDQAARNGQVLGGDLVHRAQAVERINRESALSGMAPVAPGGGAGSAPIGEPGTGGDAAPGASASSGPSAQIDGSQDAYYAARAKKEQFAAAQAELEHLQAIGRLVSTDDLQRIAHRRYRTVRDKLLNIPDRVATILAAEKDASRIHHTLTTELKRVLHELSDAAAAEAAGGSGQPMAA